MRHSLFCKLSLFIALSSTLILGACSTNSYKAPEKDPEEELTPTASVAPDGILEAVTWNIEWYGAGGQGPSDDFKQMENVLRVVDSLDADFYAFQEISSQQSLNELTGYMTDYSGVTAEYITYNQKMAVVYNENTIELIDRGYIRKQDVRPEFQEQWNYYWANGRMPFFVNFRYRYPDEDISKEFYAVIIHGKANTSDHQESYQRRQKAAEGLYYYLQDHKPNANIIMLGDYNDDLDQSIYYVVQDGEEVYQETPYDEFVNDKQHFSTISKTLSDDEESASIEYDDIIDHITMSNELFNSYIDGSVGVYKDPTSYISEYGKTTSDHLPVWAKFDVRR